MRKRPPGSGTIIARIFNMAGSAVGRTSYIGVEGVQTYSDPPPNVAYGWKPVIRSCRLIDASAPKHRSGLCDYEIGGRLAGEPRWIIKLPTEMWQEASDRR